MSPAPSVETSFLHKIFLIGFGLLLTLSIIEVLLRAGGLLIFSLQEWRNKAVLQKKDSYRIMCIGESTTQGQYPVFLERILNKASPGVRFAVIDQGMAGRTTSDILDRFEKNLDEYRPDMVIAMIGINDNGLHMKYNEPSPSALGRILHHFKCYQLLKLVYLHMVPAKKKCTELPAVKNGSAIIWKISNKEKIQDYCKTVSTGNHPGIAQCLKESILLNPRNDNAYVSYGEFCIPFVFIHRSPQKLKRAITVLRKAVMLNPDNVQALTDLGYLYYYLGFRDRGSFLFEKVRKIDPNADYSPSKENEWRKIQYAQAKAILDYRIRYFPNKAVTNYNLAASLYKEMGNESTYRYYMEKAGTAALEDADSMTVGNYHQIRKILQTRNMPLVCVQYPMRNVEALKKIFDHPEGLVFVDNEQTFKDAVRNNGYNQIFTDRFAGDFGHCTPRGNQLLAENIARAVWTDVVPPRRSLSFAQQP